MMVKYGVGCRPEGRASDWQVCPAVGVVLEAMPTKLRVIRIAIKYGSEWVPALIRETIARDAMIFSFRDSQLDTILRMETDAKS